MSNQREVTEKKTKDMTNIIQNAIQDFYGFKEWIIHHWFFYSCIFKNKYKLKNLKIEAYQSNSMWNARKSNNLKQPKTKEGSRQITWESSSLKESLK